MTVRLLLVRHGHARSADEDRNRPLSERGRAAVDAIGAMLGGSVHVDRIVHSGKARARETAERLAAWTTPRSDPHAADGLDPLADPAVWAGQLTAEDCALMVVGHLPHLAKLASLLLYGEPGAEIVTFEPGSVLCIERGEDGRWSVRWMITPTLLQATA